jgi:hypothetical protein
MQGTESFQSSHPQFHLRKKNPYKAAPRTIVQWPLKRDHRVKKIVDINQKAAFNWQLVFYRLFHNPNHTNKSVKLRETGRGGGGGGKKIQQIDKAKCECLEIISFHRWFSRSYFCIEVGPR